MAFVVDIRMLSQGVFLPFSVCMPELARIVQSLWRLLAPYNQPLSDKGNFFRGYAWHSLNHSSGPVKLVRRSMSNGHYLTFVLSADMLRASS